ncbi:TonB-dependent receptor [Sphingomonas sp. PP-CE-1G-424]|uniref:TonB-dependent receptor plug domain-containing protein n=1 Tax=Sphingomonas sp. PP-CE-1G-424 TaxID=2135658 RepID=UPI001054C1DC|nr:TonB-dependent receptor [Sphingomonas sp. PP-CE-1G-424]TCP72566.1 vitamin B12 transporter [Sphingomonas sp. PP-CE-1G-424]
MTKTFLFLSAAAAIASPAYAQSIPDGDTPELVVTAARVAQPASEVGQAVTVIDRAEIERRQTTVVSDLLATTPGVTVTRNGSVGALTGVRIRGAESDQTLVVIDGVRVNDPSSTGGGFNFANLLSSSVERIEVLRGPNSVPWGSQAIGGVVNIITATPTEGVQARANAEYGYADSVFASAGVSGAKGPVSGSLTGGYLRTDGISSAASGTERDGYRQYGAAGRLGVEFAPGIGLDLRGYFADSKVDIDGFPAPDFVLADDPEYSKTQEIYGYAGLHANFADGRFNNRIAFTIADINRDNYDPTFGTDPSFIGRGRSERYEYQGDFRPLDQVRVVAGVERENSRYSDGFSYADTGITSVYGQLIVKPIDILTLTGGVRNDDHDDFGNHTTFGANAALALRTGTTLRASYGEGFKAPTLYQLFSDYGNRGLDPETARNFDVGVEQAFLGNRARVGVTYFNRRTRNQIDFRSCSDAEQATTGSICANRPFGVYDNVARAEADGAEFTLALRPVDALTLTANYSYIHTENRSIGDDFGKTLARRPEQTASVNADYRFPFGLSIGGTVTMVGDSFDDSANAVRLDGYALGGVRAEFPIGERFAVYGRVDNITDASYQTIAGYGTYGRAAYGGVRLRLK